MHAAHIHGVIAKNKNKTPNKIFICGFIISIGAFIIPTLNIITGILKIIIIRLPIEKFLLFNKFIDPEIEEIEVKIGDPIRKVNKIKVILFVSGEKFVPV